MSFPIQRKQIYFSDGSIEMFVPDPVAVKEAFQKGNISFPYWSQVWPAAIALAEFLLRYPAYIQHKNILELGAGLGLPSLLAARFATQVLCTDGAPEAVSVAKQSAENLGLQNFAVDVLDWGHLPEGLPADVLLLSDVNYDPQALDALMKMTDKFLEDGTIILLSTPQRLVAKDFIAPLLAYCKRQEEIMVVENEIETPIAVLVLER